MARIRTVKPEIAKHEALFELEKSSGFPIRLAYILLWTQCDRAGRFRWRPRPLKTDIFPYDDLDMEAVLMALVSGGFVLRYSHEGQDYGWLPSFTRHQLINNREAESSLPPHPNDACGTREARVDHASGTRHEGNGTDDGRERIADDGKDASAAARCTRRNPGSSREWDSCLAMMSEMRFDSMASLTVRRSSMDDLALERLLKDARDPRIKKKAGWVCAALKEAGAG